MTAVLELIKECSGEDGVCTLLLETLAYVLEGSSVDMPWLYGLGIIESDYWDNHLLLYLFPRSQLVLVPDDWYAL